MNKGYFLTSVELIDGYIVCRLVAGGTVHTRTGRSERWCSLIPARSELENTDSDFSWKVSDDVLEDFLANPDGVFEKHQDLAAEFQALPEGRRNKIVTAMLDYHNEWCADK